MPLRAIADTEELIAPLLDDNEWERVKTGYRAKKIKLSLPCCGSDAVMRVSKLGTKHFAHKRKIPDCDWKPETWQHLKAKTEIALACRDAGWEVKTEAAGDGWRADVLAVKGKAKVAFEFQWSRQSLAVTEERQERYKRDGIDCYWFFKALPIDRQSNVVRSDLPMFEVVTTFDDHEVFVSLKQDDSDHLRHYRLLDFVSLLLKEHIRFCNQIQFANQWSVQVIFYENLCWRCNKVLYLYYLDALYTQCSIDLKVWVWQHNNKQLHTEIRAAIENSQSILTGTSRKCAFDDKEIDQRLNASVMPFRCPYCNAKIGDFATPRVVLDRHFSSSESYRSLTIEIDVELAVPAEYPHWCLPSNGNFCCERKTATFDMS